jgi:hypothetical protein
MVVLSRERCSEFRLSETIRVVRFPNRCGYLRQGRSITTPSDRPSSDRHGADKFTIGVSEDLVHPEESEMDFATGRVAGPLVTWLSCMPCT